MDAPFGSNNSSRHLPPYLLIDQAQEPEELPLQVLLLTGEIAALRQRVELLEIERDASSRG